MADRIVITGGSGTIGTVLARGLNGRHVTRIWQPWIDLKHYWQTERVTRGHDVAIHLAWDTGRENFDSPQCFTGNTTMFVNLYRAALENGLKRVIMASSVHADHYWGWQETQPLLSVHGNSNPSSPYGLHKVFMENLGRYYAEKGLEVVCVRFGAVTRNNRPWYENMLERRVFLDSDDCISHIEAILDADIVPGRFTVTYAVSDSPYRIHDISNPFGWQPPWRQLDPPELKAKVHSNCP